MFSAQEKTELKKLAQASYDLGSILIRICTLRQMGGEPVVPLATQVKAYAPQGNLNQAHYELGIAVEYFQGVPMRWMPQGLPRAAQVAGGFDRIAAAITKLQASRPAFVTLAAADSSQAMNVTDVDRIIASLQSIDKNLTYATPWDSVDVPIVAQGGNHGDLELAFKSHSSVHLYGSAVYGAIRVALQAIPGATTTGVTLGSPTQSIYDHFYDLLAAMGRFYQRHASTWLALLDVILDSERAVIEADHAASSGVRGFDFFRLQRQSENVGAGGFNFVKPLLSGRNPVGGMGHRLYEAQFAATAFLKVSMNDPSADAAQLRNLAAHMETVFIQLDSVWVYVDKVRDTYFMFHHALQNVPVPPPVNDCEQRLAAALAENAQLRTNAGTAISHIDAAKDALT